MPHRRWTPIALLPILAWACTNGTGGTDATTPLDPGPLSGDIVQPADGLQDSDAADRDVPGDLATDSLATDTTQGSDAAPDTGTPISEECAAVTPGATTQNVLTVQGVKRRFLVSVPDGATGPGGNWPIVFQWHGFVGTNMGYSDVTEAASWHKDMLGPAVNDARMPLILVTPLSSGTEFLDWAILDTYAGASNPDVDFFDAILGCMDARFGVDPDHVHSVGFSAGGILTDKLGVMRGDKLASTLTWSGAYLGNPANAIDTFEVIWPDPGPSSGWTQVVFHGGTSDQWQAGAMFTAHFNLWTEADVGYLNGLGHDVVLCTHTYGHTPPPNANPVAYVVDFFKAHPRGTTDSPFAAGLPASFPKTCTFHAKTN